MAAETTEAVIISGPRKGEIILLDENGQEIVPGELLEALREMNVELRATVKAMRDVRAAFTRCDMGKVHHG